MSATLDPDGIPPQALRIWTDGRSIFVAIPGEHGPYITSYLYTQNGLGRALDLLGQHRLDYDYKGKIPDGYLKPSKQPGTETQRAQAEAILRRMGVIK